MEIRSQLFKNIVLMLFALVLCACASTAHRPIPCKAGMDAAFLYGGVYWMAGTVLQQFDCAVIDPIKFEWGEYYSRKKTGILYEVQLGKGGPGENIKDFGRSFNCSEETIGEFERSLLENKNEIFGSEFGRSDREVTKATMRMIDLRPELGPTRS